MHKNTSQNSTTGTREPEEYAGVGYVAALYQFHPGKVLYQIKVGRLPALAVIGGNGRLTAYAIKLADAEHLWGTAPKHFPSDNAKNAA